MDLGECSKIHDIALTADYKNAAKTHDYFYDVDVRDTVRCRFTVIFIVCQHSYMLYRVLSIRLAIHVSSACIVSFRCKYCESFTSYGGTFILQGAPRK